MARSEAKEQATFQTLLIERRCKTGFISLEELYDAGMAQRHVADMLETTVWDIRRWQREGRGWFTDLMKIAHLLAVLDALKQFGIDDPVAFLETPVHKDSSITPMQLYPKDLSLILGLATGRVTKEKVLDIHDSGWRRRSPSKWEVFEADDGGLAIGLRSGSAES